MKQMELLEKISTKKANLLVIGMGYVGIPLAISFAREEFHVTGYDINPEKVNSLNQGIYPIKGNEPGMPELVTEVVAKGNFRATTNSGLIASSDVIFVVVDTPLIGQENNRRPNLHNLEKACEVIGKYLKKGAMVIIESTLAPLTMQKTVQPIIENSSKLIAGKDFLLCHCPERVMPGRLLHNLLNYDRVIGGINLESARIAKELYSHIVKGELVTTSLIHAELTKTGENAYRDMEIAFANMLALLCDDLGANVYEVRDLINRSPYRNVHMPGAGVGGHCIPKDSILMISNASKRFRGVDGFDSLVLTCRDINDYMPMHMRELLESSMETQIHLSTFCDYEFIVAILGYSYLPESDDDRCSPTQTLLENLDLATEIRLHDPFVPKENMCKALSSASKYFTNYAVAKTWQEAVKGADAVIIMVAHNEYKNIPLRRLQGLMSHNPSGNIIIDGRNVFDKKSARELGFIYKGIGNIC